MSRRRCNEPFFWSLFSSGGMISALILPGLVFFLWIATPLGWWQSPSYADLVMLLENPLLRAGLFIVISLSAVHWGHRFRFTLYDGLQLSHLYGLIATVCYGGAALIVCIAAYVLWSFA
ncbi:MAG: fumarate reductase subunit D [Thermoanaerobaculia bacterium]